MQEDLFTAVLIDENTHWRRVDICQHYHISEDLLAEMEEHGLFDTCFAVTESKEKVLTQKAVTRLEKACRLHADLGINLPGVVLALELLEEMETLRHQLAILSR